MRENPYQSPLAACEASRSPIRWTPFALVGYLAAFTAFLGSLVACVIEPQVALDFDPLALLNACQVALIVAWIASEACLFIDGRRCPE